MVGAFILLALGAAATAQRPGWMGEDLLFDCQVARTSGPEGPVAIEDRPHRYVLFLRGNRPEGFPGEDEDYVPSLEVHDPDRLLPFSPAFSMYSMSYVWPDYLAVGIPAYDGVGPHQERFPPEGFGGIFRPIRIDPIAGRAEVVLLQHTDWHRSIDEPAPPSNFYAGHCRLLRGGAAYSAFEEIDR